MSRIAILTNLLVLVAGCGEMTVPTDDIDASTQCTDSGDNRAETTASGAKMPERKTIVTLTPAAAAKVHGFREVAGLPYFRVGVKRGGPTGFEYDVGYDDQLNAEQDYLDESHGLKILVDRKSALFLEGTSIDWRITEEGRESLHFTNPNALDLHFPQICV